MEVVNCEVVTASLKLTNTLFIICYFFVGAFVKNRILFALLRLVCGMGGMGVYMVAAVIAAEATLPRSVWIINIDLKLSKLLKLESRFIRNCQNILKKYFKLSNLL